MLVPVPRHAALVPRHRRTVSESSGGELSAWYRETLGVPELIRVRGKVPIDAEWPTGPREHPALARALLEEWHGNLGLLTGQLANGLYLVVIDADLYLEGAADSLAALYELGLPRRTPTVLTGGGGEQLYVTSPHPVPSRPLPGYPGIDIKSTGGMVVVPYSVHASGELYEWEYGYSPDDLPLAPLPAALLALLGTTLEETSARTRHELGARDLEALELLEQHYGAHGAVERNGYIEVTRPGKDARDGGSATIGAVGAGVAHVFSSNWHELPAGTYNVRELRARRQLADPDAQRIAAAIPTTAQAAPPSRFVRAATVVSREQRWLWRGLVPEGHFMLTAGREELGKSAAMLWVGARLTRGDLAGDLEGVPATVLYCSLEDDADRVLKPRAVAAGADLERLYFLDPTGAGFSLDDIHELAPKLVVLDPVSSFVRLPANNEHGEHAVRHALGPLLAYALEHEATVIGVRHVRKGGPLESPYDAILGSRAWSAAPRAHLIFAPDRARTEEPGGLIFPRGNLARGGLVHRYRLASATVALDAGGETEVPLFTLEGAGVAGDLEEALRPATSAKTGRPAVALEYAKEWLALALVEPVQAKQLAREARQCGISAVTLERARKELGIRSRPRSAVNGKRRWWVEWPTSSLANPMTIYTPQDEGDEEVGPAIPVAEPNGPTSTSDEVGPTSSDAEVAERDHEE